MAAPYAPAPPYTPAQAQMTQMDIETGSEKSCRLCWMEPRRGMAECTAMAYSRTIGAEMLGADALCARENGMIAPCLCKGSIRT